MKYISLLLIWLALADASKAQSSADIALSFLKKLERRQYDSCHAMMDTIMASKITPQLLEQTWESLPRYLGEFKSYTFVSSDKKTGSDEFLYRYEFEKMKLDMRVTVDSQKKISGALLAPPKSTSAYTPPEYYQPEKFYETKLNVKTGRYEMPGLLCVPNNITDPPVVILLSGSGPNDKDESIGPIKVLKDIAIGLAAKGIASLRYDDRTFVYGEELVQNNVNIGINEEVVEDAVSAAQLLKTFPLTSKSKIIVAGHSLGGMCAPMIAAKSKNVDAIILLAGNARPLEDLLLGQFQYIYGLDSLTREEKTSLDELKEQIRIVKDPNLLKKATADKLPLNLPPFYWQSIKNYDQVKTAKKLKQPILVLQGERDYQVTMADFKAWNEELNTQSKNKFISYPDLNHLFIKGEGKSNPGEYEKQGNVDERVIKDMAFWIKEK
jgi:dienelactone hydrolase